MTEELILRPGPGPEVKTTKPTREQLVAALVASPGTLTAFLRDLPEDKRQQVVAVALGRAVAELVREQAGPVVAEIVRTEAPTRVRKAMDEATACYQWSGRTWGTLVDWCRDALRKEITEQLQKKAVALAASVVLRMRLQIEPGEDRRELVPDDREIPCPFCGGVGERSCPSCGGTGDECVGEDWTGKPCPKCKGSGFSDCDSCGSTGVYRQDTDPKETR